MNSPVRLDSTYDTSVARRRSIPLDPSRRLASRIFAPRTAGMTRPGDSPPEIQVSRQQRLRPGRSKRARQGRNGAGTECPRPRARLAKRLPVAASRGRHLRRRWRLRPALSRSVRALGFAQRLRPCLDSYVKMQRSLKARPLGVKGREPTIHNHGCRRGQGRSL